jgi:hypothetical protein
MNSRASSSASPLSSTAYRTRSTASQAPGWSSPRLLVRAFAVHGVLIADDVVELIGIVIEH